MILHPVGHDHEVLFVRVSVIFLEFLDRVFRVLVNQKLEDTRFLEDPFLTSKVSGLSCKGFSHSYRGCQKSTKVEGFSVVVRFHLTGSRKLQVTWFFGLTEKKQVRMKALLEQQGLAAALEELPTATIAAYDNVIQKKSFSTLILCLGDRVLQEITKETTAAGI
ncbi:hypothetical protein Tco_0410914 [Tanacetum coccineum]